MTLKESNRIHIIATCIARKWNLAAAWRTLGISHKTLYNRLHEYERDGFVVHERTRWRATRAGMELVSGGQQVNAQHGGGQHEQRNPAA